MSDWKPDTKNWKEQFVKDHCRGRFCSDCVLGLDHTEWCGKHPFANCTDADWDEAYKLIQESNKPKSTPKRMKSNPVDHPDHYNQGGIECIDAMISAFGKDKVADFCAINAFKYIWRYQRKNGDEDVHKASWYLEKYKELKGEDNADEKAEKAD